MLLEFHEWKKEKMLVTRLNIFQTTRFFCEVFKILLETKLPVVRWMYCTCLMPSFSKTLHSFSLKVASSMEPISPFSSNTTEKVMSKLFEIQLRLNRESADLYAIISKQINLESPFHENSCLCSKCRSRSGCIKCAAPDLYCPPCKRNAVKRWQGICCYLNLYYSRLKISTRFIWPFNPFPPNDTF